MIKMVIWFWNTFTKGFLINVSQVSFNFLPPEANIFHNCTTIFEPWTKKDIIPAAGRGWKWRVGDYP
jgi:hypothetical protein